MTVFIHVKQLSKRKSNIAAHPYELNTTPETLRALIRSLVLISVAEYNQRIQNKDGYRPAGPDEMDAMSRIGKIGFGIPFGSREADPEAAAETALQGFEDGLFRFFVGDTEVESLDAPLQLRDGDSITIIRLTMLSGGFFW